MFLNAQPLVVGHLRLYHILFVLGVQVQHRFVYGTQFRLVPIVVSSEVHMSLVAVLAGPAGIDVGLRCLVETLKQFLVLNILALAGHFVVFFVLVVVVLRVLTCGLRVLVSQVVVILVALLQFAFLFQVDHF